MVWYAIEGGCVVTSYPSFPANVAVWLGSVCVCVCVLGGRGVRKVR